MGVSEDGLEVVAGAAELQERVDDSSFPLVRSAFPKTATDAFVTRYFAFLRAQAERGPFVLMADVRPLDTSSANAKIRAAFFEASQAFDRDVGPAHYLGEAVIVSSTLQRALLSAYMWFVNDAPYPTRVFRDIEAAEKWCTDRLIEAGAITTSQLPAGPIARGQDG